MLQVAPVTTPRLLGAVNIRELGARGDGSTDDTAAWVRAIVAANGTQRRPIYVPPGTYKVTGVTFPSWLEVRGAGRGRTTIMLANTAGLTTDAVTITGADAVANPADANFGGLYDLSITPQSLSAGRHAVNFDLNADNRQIVQYTIERCYLQGSTSAAGGNARALVNTPQGVQVNPMFALHRFIGNRFYGGVRLLDVQDSILFDHNYFAGPNVGLEFRANGGAGKLMVTRNNIVSDGGGIWIRSTSGSPLAGLTISDNYIEKLSAWVGGSGNTALIDLDGSTAGDILVPMIARNQLSLLATFGGAGKSCLRLKNTSKASIEGNNFHPIDASTIGGLVTTGTSGTYWGRGNKLGAGAGTLFSNSSVDTAAEYGLAGHVQPATTVGQLGNLDLVGALRAERLSMKVGAAIASAATIAPTGNADGTGGTMFFVSGTTTINTITPRTGPGNTVDGDYIILVALGAWALGNTGNIKAGAAAMTANRAIHLVYYSGTSSWYEIGRGAA